MSVNFKAMQCAIGISLLAVGLNVYSTASNINFFVKNSLQKPIKCCFYPDHGDLHYNGGKYGEGHCLPPIAPGTTWPSASKYATQTHTDDKAELRMICVVSKNGTTATDCSSFTNHSINTYWDSASNRYKFSNSGNCQICGLIKVDSDWNSRVHTDEFVAYPFSVSVDVVPEGYGGNAALYEIKTQAGPGINQQQDGGSTIQPSN